MFEIKLNPAELQEKKQRQAMYKTLLEGFSVKRTPRENDQGLKKAYALKSK